MKENLLPTSRSGGFSFSNFKGRGENSWDRLIYHHLTFFVSFSGLLPGPKSYFLDFPNVFVTTCGTSFYSQCLPPQSVNLVFSATAMHWLRDKPCDVTGALHHTMITVPEEAEKFRNQAAKDWETLLLARAKELAPGKYTWLTFKIK